MNNVVQLDEELEAEALLGEMLLPNTSHPISFPKTSKLIQNTSAPLNSINHEKRLARKKQTAEDFTPLWLVNQMIDKLLEYSPDTFSDPNKTFLDPAAGNGNMLIEVLKRKLKYASPIQAISTIYGCDIQKDNIIECRLRLLKVIVKNKTQKLSKKEYIEIIKILAKNIVCTPLSKYPNGSLDYLSLPENKTFNRILSDESAEKTLNQIVSKKLLDELIVE